jgi:probable HAF family extracellular repeat protein
MTTWNKSWAVALLALLAMPLAARAQAPAPTALPLFSVTVLPEQMNGANAMNREGHVVGSGAQGVWLWNGTGATQLAAAAPGYSDGLGINDSDAVAGTSYAGTGIAFANIGGAVQNIGAAAPDFRSSYARGINDAGWVVGAFSNGVGGIESRPYIYRNGNVQLLPTLGGNAGAALAVSNNGYVTGQAALATTAPFSGGGHAFLYQNGNTTDLGTLSGDDLSSGLAVNDRGAVVGISALAGQPGNRAFLSWRGRMANLGSLGGTSTTPFAVNNYLVVVGSASTAAQVEHGFVYAFGRMIDLNRFIDPASGWVINAALGINDSFQILVRACRTDFPLCRAARLEPSSAIRNGGLAGVRPLFSQ